MMFEVWDIAPGNAHIAHEDNDWLRACSWVAIRTGELKGDEWEVMTERGPRNWPRQSAYRSYVVFSRRKWRHVPFFREYRLLWVKARWGVA